MNLIKERHQIVDMSLKMYTEYLIVGTWGNLSIRVSHDGQEFFVVTPSGMEYETTTMDDILVVDSEGKTLVGKRRPTSELKMHLISTEDAALMMDYYKTQYGQR